MSCFKYVGALHKVAVRGQADDSCKRDKIPPPRVSHPTATSITVKQALTTPAGGTISITKDFGPVHQHRFNQVLLPQHASANSQTKRNSLPIFIKSDILINPSTAQRLPKPGDENRFARPIEERKII